MRVLITGATGFAGRHLAAAFAGQGATVIGVGRRPAAEADPPEALSSYLEGDLTDAGRTEEIVQSTALDLVFHLAAEASVVRSWKDPAGVINANLASTVNLLEAVRQYASRARVLLACSGEEYGPPEHLPVTEEHPLRPQNPYAVSKASVDLLGGFYNEAHGLHIVRARAFNHAGPNQTDTYVVASLARQIAEAEASPETEEPVEIAVGNIDVRRDFADVRDVVRAYRAALERADPGVYNVCIGRAIAIRDILAGLASHTALEVEYRADPDLVREHEVMEIRGSHDKLTQATGWQPEIPLEQTLRDTLEWWRTKLAAEVPT
jgi:GDP-4-dehydro-6-deoxy-D-mannose reductase